MWPYMVCTLGGPVNVAASVAERAGAPACEDASAANSAIAATTRDVRPSFIVTSCSG
jgi:hypothetical protein